MAELLDLTKSLLYQYYVMHAYLLIGTDKDYLNKRTDSLSAKLGKQEFQFQIQKIDQVRKLSEFIKLSLEKPTVIICKDIDNASIESLNAFLKILEEPQKNIKFILTAANEYQVIPTIVSRCQITRVVNIKETPDKTLAENFLKMSVSQRLNEISNFKKREDAINFLEELQKGLHQILLQDNNYLQTTAYLKSLQNAYTVIKGNGNVGLQLTNFVITS